MKFIFVVGGVISGVGKGVATASIAKILSEYGFSTTIIKIDPYINCDAGTMRPTEHGEVWVTADGGEIDQDLGNYERFMNRNIPKINNITTGQIYRTVIENERAGKYLGKTVQLIPHIPDEIRRRIKLSGEGYDIALIEVGGTIGDIENIPYLFAAKGLEKECGKNSVIYILVTYLPVPTHIQEAKTKPTQHAIKLLSENGISPDFILCRAKQPLDSVRRQKIEVYSNLDRHQIISAPDVNNLYEIPLNFEKEGLGKKLMQCMELQSRKIPDWEKWKKLLYNLQNPEKTIKIAMIGKYLSIGDYQLTDSYISINESLKNASAKLGVGIKISWIDSKIFEMNPENVRGLSEYNGILVPGGFGNSGVEGKITAIKYARENRIPYLGLCYGMQLAVIEYARNMCNLKNANTTENDSNTPYPVIDILESQREVMQQNKYGGTMRLGYYAACLKPDTQVCRLYHENGRIELDKNRINSVEKFRIGNVKGIDNIILERHRHRYEVNPKFVPVFESNGIIFSGYHQVSDDNMLMEFMELPEHPFFIATQSHPEFESRFENPAPLFVGFVNAAGLNQT